MQALIKKHKAKFYYIPMGMFGGNMETLGWKG